MYVPCCACAVLVSRGRLVAQGGYCDSLTHLAVLLAALVHDYEHPGLNNDFLCAARHPVAQLYNDRWDGAWQVLACLHACMLARMHLSSRRCMLRCRIVHVIH